MSVAEIQHLNSKQCLYQLRKWIVELSCSQSRICWVTVLGSGRLICTLNLLMIRKTLHQYILHLIKIRLCRSSFLKLKMPMISAFCLIGWANKLKRIWLRVIVKEDSLIALLLLRVKEPPLINLRFWPSQMQSPSKKLWVRPREAALIIISQTNRSFATPAFSIVLLTIHIIWMPYSSAKSIKMYNLLQYR